MTSQRMFSRGQVEWAIARATGRVTVPAGEPRPDLRMTLKRLLDLDRRRGIDASRGEEDGRFAFLQGGLPGKGHAIAYHGYDAFALRLGLHLLEASVPQTATIRVLRRIGPDLRREHARILKQAPDALAGATGAAAERRIKTGMLVRDSARMSFLVLPSGVGAVYLSERMTDRGSEVANIARSPDRLLSILTHLTLISPPVLVFELVNATHQLAWWLDRAPHIHRGRQ